MCFSPALHGFVEFCKALLRMTCDKKTFQVGWDLEFGRNLFELSGLRV